MKLPSLLLLVGFLGFSLELLAHPSYGLIVRDDGTVIFCDALHHGGTIWQYREGEGLTALLTGEHCHFIFQDAQGTIWGTQHDYLERRDTNRNSLWRIGPKGRKEVVIVPTLDPSLFSGVNFTLDRQGRIYYPFQNRIYRRLPEGEPELFCDHQFERIMSLQMDSQDRLYVADTYADGGSLFRIDREGDVEQLATGLTEETPEHPPFPEPRFNLLFGITVDEKGKSYVANSGGRRVLKVTGKGEQQVEVVYRSDPPWYPVAYVQKGKTGYVMESGYENGRGNFGPRIVKWTSGKRELIAKAGTGSGGLAGNANPPASAPEGQGQIRPGLNVWIILPFFFFTLAGLFLLILFRKGSLSRNTQSSS